MVRPKKGDLIKIGAVGSAVPSQVLSGETFSNYEEVGLMGSMPNIGKVEEIVSSYNKPYKIPKGYHSGGGEVRTKLFYNSNRTSGYARWGQSNIGFMPKIIIMWFNELDGNGEQADMTIIYDESISNSYYKYSVIRENDPDSPYVGTIPVSTTDPSSYLYISPEVVRLEIPPGMFGGSGYSDSIHAGLGVHMLIIG